jgi:crotonobetaine/carnitine-CoA ligase
VALLLPNSTAFVTFWFAIGLAGAVEIPVNTEQRGPVLKHVLIDGAPRVVIAAPEFLPVIAAAGYTGPAPVIEWTEAVEAEFQAASPLHDETPEPTELAVIMYTSGTTGPSKGVMLPHAYFDNIGGVVPSMWPVHEDDTLYVASPMFHVDSRMMMAAALRTGACLAWAPRFSARSFWSDVRELRATFFLFIGAMLAILAKTSTAEMAAGTQLRAGHGAPVPPEAYEFFEDRLGIQLFEGYGLTEAVSVTWLTPERRRRGSAGWEAGPYIVRVMGPDGRLLAPEETGEIVFRPTGPGLMTSGYWRRPDATVEAFRDLWFHTGDLGRMDEDGFLWFVGRQKDVIRRRGENVSAFEVEATMARLAGVLECAAIPVRDEIGGEDEVFLLVVTLPDAGLTPGDIVEYAETHLARFAVPRYVELASELPHTPTGKLAKHALRVAPGPATFDRLKAAR